MHLVPIQNDELVCFYVFCFFPYHHAFANETAQAFIPPPNPFSKFQFHGAQHLAIPPTGSVGTYPNACHKLTAPSWVSLAALTQNNWLARF